MDTYRTGCEFTADLLDSIPELKSYATKLRGMSSDWLLEKCVEIVNSSSTISVLNHGDYHVRNMMFKDNEFNAVSEVVLVDFQIPHWGSPAFDLIYMSGALNYDQREMAYMHYFNTFSDVLVKTGYKGAMPTYEELMNELKKFACLDLLFSSSLALFIRFEREKLEGSDMSRILTDSEFRKSFYKTPSYVEYVKDVVPKILDIVCK